MRLLPPRKFKTAKAGNRPGECEDAANAVYPYRLAPGRGEARAVVVDGASESAFAQSWAEILADAFVRQPHLDLSNLDGPSFAKWLRPLQQEWSDKVPWDRIPWHGEAKTKAGAMAAFLGVTFFRKTRRGLGWRAVAVGDCCLFIIRDEAIHFVFPLTDPAQFNNSPLMIGSNPANNPGIRGLAPQAKGECRPGDRIILASDALACWILQTRDAGGKPWESLFSLESRDQWETWVQDRRSERTIRNDDTTMIAIRVE